MKYTYALDIHAPIDKVFDFLRDHDKLKLWLQGLEETSYVGDVNPENPIGAKFKQKIREGGRVQEYDGEVTAFAPPKHLGIRLFGKGFSAQVDYHLTPVAEGTHFNYSSDVPCAHWFIRLMGRL